MADLDIRFELNPASIFQNCPEDPGLYVLEDEAGDLLLVDYANNLTQGVTKHLPENEMKSEVIRLRARYFRFFLTEDRAELARQFDRWVRRKGAFPLGMSEAPKGSDWYGRPDPSAAARAEPPASTRESPAIPTGVVPASSPRGATRGGDRPLEVLLVDDEVQLLVLMKEFLEMEGIRVRAAANARMLADALRTGPVDAVVMDFHLPDLKPEAVLEAIRRLAPQALVLLITATEEKEQAYGLLEKGVRKIFPKPFSMKMLTRTILDYFAGSGGG